MSAYSTQENLHWIQMVYSKMKNGTNNKSERALPFNAVLDSHHSTAIP